MKKRYKRNFIANFIIRFDFEKYNEIDVEKIAEKFREEVPIIEKKNIQDHQIVIDGAGENKIGAPRIETTNLIHEISMINSKQDQRVKISDMFFTYETTNYKTFDDIKKIISPILDFLETDNQVKRYKRFGIRYINLINLPCKNKKELLDWNDYINEELLSSNNIFGKKELLQLIHIHNIKSSFNDDIIYTVQSGMPNQNFPASLMEKNFLIDIDGYSKVLMEKNEIIEMFDDIHNEEDEIFETCIKDELRRIMNE